MATKDRPQNVGSDVWFTLLGNMAGICNDEHSRYDMDYAVVMPADDGVLLVGTDGRTAVSVLCEGKVDRPRFVPRAILDKPTDVWWLESQSMWLTTDGRHIRHDDAKPRTRAPVVDVLPDLTANKWLWLRVNCKRLAATLEALALQHGNDGTLMLGMRVPDSEYTDNSQITHPLIAVPGDGQTGGAVAVLMPGGSVIVEDVVTSATRVCDALRKAWPQKDALRGGK